MRQKLPIIAGAAVAAALLAGCGTAPPASPDPNFTASSGAERAVPGIASKTFAAPVTDVRVAVLKSLRRLDVKVMGEGRTEHGWKIMAVDSSRVIEIQLDLVAPNTTRMRVVLGDEDGEVARASEIVLQTSDVLGPAPIDENAA